MIEVTSLDQAVVATAEGFDVIQAEKFSPEQIASVVARLTPANGIGTRPLIAAAGGINAENSAAYAAAGADVLVTSSPYTARPRDVQVKIARA